MNNIIVFYTFYFRFENFIHFLEINFRSKRINFIHCRFKKFIDFYFLDRQIVLIYSLNEEKNFNFLK